MLLPLVAALALTTGADQPSQPEGEKQRIANPGYFDVATCAPAKPKLSGTPNKQTLQGALQFARPLLWDCLTDPKSHGPDAVAKLSVDVSVANKALATKVSGTNVTPDGIACAQKAVDRYLGSLGIDASKLAADTAARYELNRNLGGAFPAPVLGLNEASDAAARVRLALPTACDCFGDVATTAPYAVLKGQLKLSKPEKPAEVSPSEVTFPPTNDAAGDKLAACLKGKVSALKMPAPTNDLIVPFTVRLVNSNVGGKLPGATPDVQFAQYDLESSLAGAQALVDDGARMAPAAHFSELINGYNAHKKGLKLTDVAASCPPLLEADKQLVDDTQHFVDLSKEIHAFIAELAAKEPAWAPSEKATAARADAVQKQLAAVQTERDGDAANCAKVTTAESAPVTTGKKKGKK
ncbi:MAG: hypothetical protein JST54_01395 [Deltaproteobacteria bacterium]|nr:hypothetical protein [Deltaproteobacteria bacterium]